MAYPQAHTVSLATDASGDDTEYTATVWGRCVGVLWRPTDMDAGSDLTVTTEDTAQTVVIKANIGASAASLYPVTQVHDAADGSAIAATYDSVRVAGERVKVVVAQGGNTKTGDVIILIE